MAQIIALTPSFGPSRHTPAGGSAEILFFMGVRYHRMSDEEFANATAPKPRRAAKGKTSTATRVLENHG